MNPPNMLDSLFEPKNIILIGAAHTDKKLGGTVLNNLLRSKARIYPVNPKSRDTVLPLT
ncbi:MAG TPA: CoA-binding protein [Dissulfurispiraceae bacterium]|nr:CoA-binding protein [Dissulfurispiraceae bacterium]